MISDELLTAIDITIRAALRYDPAARQKLQQLAGKNLKVKLKFPELTLYISIVGDAPEISYRPPSEDPDAEVSGYPSDFLKAITSPEPGLAKGLEIRGDSQLVLTLQNILQELDIDWEGWLADHIGDLAAHQISGIAHGVRQYSQQSGELLRNNLKDFLQEELGVLPTRQELEDFYDNVDELRLQTDRVMARLKLLETSTQAQDSKADAANDS